MFLFLAWERGQEFFPTRRPEPPPKSARDLVHGISGCHIDDIPQRPPPTPPKGRHQNMNSPSQSPKRFTDFQQSNLPRHPASPPFGFGVQKHHFDSSYAKHSAMPQFHLISTTSHRGSGYPDELDEHPEYCDMDTPDEQSNHEVNLPRKPFNRYPAMPPVEQPSADQGKYPLSQYHGNSHYPAAVDREKLPTNSTQMHGKHGARFSDRPAVPSGLHGIKATNSKPPPPLKPAVPRKPNQLVAGSKGKPLPPVKPSNLHASHPPTGGVNVMRAAFELNQR